jgi:nitrite reductase (NAD(P)H)
MADILAFNLCQTKTKMGAHAPRKMNHPDLSTKLKLMGVEVSSFGDFFADQDLQRRQPLVETVPRTVPIEVEAEVDSASRLADSDKRNGRKVKRAVPLEDEQIKSLVFRDPIAGTYKKYLFSKDVCPKRVHSALRRALADEGPHHLSGHATPRWHDGRRLLRLC